MRSIRFSLAVYLLGLLTVSLAATAWVVDRSVESALLAKADVSRALVRTQCEEQCHRLHEEFDTELLTKARALAAEAQPLFQPTPARLLSINPLGALTTVGPSGYAAIPFHVAQGVRSPLTWQLSAAVSTDLPLVDAALSPGGSDAEYAQINTERGNIWRSESLRPNRLELDADAAWKMALLDSKYDDAEVAGTPVRRVVLKASVSRLRFAWHNSGKKDPTLIGSFPNPGEKPGERPAGGRPPGERPSGDRSPPSGEKPGERPQGPPKPPPFSDSAAPPMLVQVAAPTTRRDQAVADLKSDRDARLTALDEETRAGLEQLRWQLGGVTAGTLSATLLGGLLLVSLGLAPLQRLSDAVSRVTPKAFRLDVDPARLPAELAPIAARLGTTLQELERAFAREKQATADISHELRTPLAALLTNIDVSLRKPRTVEQYRTTLEECRDAGRQLKKLVEQLLELARLDAGNVRTARKAVEISPLAEQCAAMLRPLAEEQGVTLSAIGEPGLLATTDPDRLREVLTNLMHNAVEYNRPGGRVDVSATATGNEVVLTVRDTGIGMSPDVQSRIFERFYRADPSREATGLHSGLGLAIVKETVGLLGGRIAVESEAGVGTTFRVWLPR